MKQTSGSLSTIGSLVQINHKRLAHYKRSADKAKEIELKLLFMRYAVQSQGFVNVLSRWMMEYGGKVAQQEEGGLASAWSRIRETLNSDSRNHLLSRAEMMESEVLRIYKTILSLTILPSPVLRDIQSQYDELENTARVLKSRQQEKIVRGLQAAA
ncbi:PA2169 family four-helix-bundle protein [Pseudochryseolinea flava]|uniref:DUF2383 domain-containing protein n=1 Tax=Pseudochryseolinea flava TaxID=2059302 RepID=A0A364Y2D2_9BACT|nr:PA2169 family four-helix-bundle protein [Pseudochryseolinea flava]RAW00120.1 hypothetical protein DQQ10_16350 [Pseudochryseolinea flava]